MVVFKAIEGLDNATVNLTRPHNSSKAIGLSNLPYPLPCYYQVYTLDIEVDGSIGTVPLPRELGNHLTNVHSVESCILVNVSKY